MSEAGIGLYFSRLIQGRRELGAAWNEQELGDKCEGKTLHLAEIPRPSILDRFRVKEAAPRAALTSEAARNK